MLIDIKLETQCTVSMALHIAGAFTKKARELEEHANTLEGLEWPDMASEVHAMAITLRGLSSSIKDQIKAQGTGGGPG